jgi:HEPN domain-containing protein
MEKGINSYYSLAADDLLYSKSLLTSMKDFNKFNGVASLCAQSAEKFMKAFIEDSINSSNIRLLKSHNLKRLLKEIKRIEPECNLSEKDYKWLGDFYFEARYPGDDFTIVSYNEAVDCIKLAEELKLWIDRHSVKTLPPKSDLKRLSDMDDL